MNCHTIKADIRTKLTLRQAARCNGRLHAMSPTGCLGRTLACRHHDSEVVQQDGSCSCAQGRGGRATAAATAGPAAAAAAAPGRPGAGSPRTACAALTTGRRQPASLDPSHSASLIPSHHAFDGRFVMDTLSGTGFGPVISSLQDSCVALPRQVVEPSLQGSGAMASSGSGPVPGGNSGGDGGDDDTPMAESPSGGDQQPGTPIVVQVRDWQPSHTTPKCIISVYRPSWS